MLILAVRVVFDTPTPKRTKQFSRQFPPRQKRVHAIITRGFSSDFLLVCCLFIRRVELCLDVYWRLFLINSRIQRTRARTSRFKPVDSFQLLEIRTAHARVSVYSLTRARLFPKVSITCRRKVINRANSSNTHWHNCSEICHYLLSRCRSESK